MKKIIAVLLLAASPAFADHDLKVAVDKGTYIETASLSGSSTAGTAFISANPKRIDGLIFNNTAVAIWIGTNTATQHGAQHENIRIGLPVLASATYRLEGIMPGTLYFTCSIGVSSCEARVLEHKNR